MLFKIVILVTLAKSFVVWNDPQVLSHDDCSKKLEYIMDHIKPLHKGETMLAKCVPVPRVA